MRLVRSIYSQEGRLVTTEPTTCAMYPQQALASMTILPYRSTP